MRAEVEPKARPRVEDFAMRRIWAISAFSGSGMAIHYTAETYLAERVS
jgi:hypothetical protein